MPRLFISFCQLKLYGERFQRYIAVIATYIRTSVGVIHMLLDVVKQKNGKMQGKGRFSVGFP